MPGSRELEGSVCSLGERAGAMGSSCEVHLCKVGALGEERENRGLCCFGVSDCVRDDWEGVLTDFDTLRQVESMGSSRSQILNRISGGRDRRVVGAVLASCVGVSILVMWFSTSIACSVTFVMATFIGLVKLAAVMPESSVGICV